MILRVYLLIYYLQIYLCHYGYKVLRRQAPNTTVFSAFYFVIFMLTEQLISLSAIKISVKISDTVSLWSAWWSDCFGQWWRCRLSVREREDQKILLSSILYPLYFQVLGRVLTKICQTSVIIEKQKKKVLNKRPLDISWLHDS